MYLHPLLSLARTILVLTFVLVTSPAWSAQLAQNQEGRARRVVVTRILGGQVPIYDVTLELIFENVDLTEGLDIPLPAAPREFSVKASFVDAEGDPAMQTLQVSPTSGTIADQPRHWLSITLPKPLQRQRVAARYHLMANVTVSLTKSPFTISYIADLDAVVQDREMETATRPLRRELFLTNVTEIDWAGASPEVPVQVIVQQRQKSASAVEILYFGVFDAVPKGATVGRSDTVGRFDADSLQMLIGEDLQEGPVSRRILIENEGELRIPAGDIQIKSAHLPAPATLTLEQSLMAAPVGEAPCRSPHQVNSHQAILDLSLDAKHSVHRKHMEPLESCLPLSLHDKKMIYLEGRRIRFLITPPPSASMAQIQWFTKNPSEAGIVLIPRKSPQGEYELWHYNLAIKTMDWPDTPSEADKKLAAKLLANLQEFSDSHHRLIPLYCFDPRLKLQEITDPKYTQDLLKALQKVVPTVPPSLGQQRDEQRHRLEELIVTHEALLRLERRFKDSPDDSEAWRSILRARVRRESLEREIHKAKSAVRSVEARYQWANGNYPVDIDGTPFDLVPVREAGREHSSTAGP